MGRGQRPSFLEENGNGPTTEAANNGPTTEDNRSAGGQEAEAGPDNGNMAEDFPLCLVFSWDTWQDEEAFQELLDQIEEAGG